MSKKTSLKEQTEKGTAAESSRALGVLHYLVSNNLVSCFGIDVLQSHWHKKKKHLEFLIIGNQNNKNKKLNINFLTFLHILSNQNRVKKS